MTSTTLQRVAVVSLNASNLCALLNVADEQHFLKHCMSPEIFEECIQGGDTNMVRVQILCEKVIQEIMAGSMKMYDALCEYLLKRSEAYKAMHQRFTTTACTDDGSSLNNSISSELLFLHEKVKYLTEEVLFWRHSHSPAVCQINLKETNNACAANESKNCTKDAINAVLPQKLQACNKETSSQKPASARDNGDTNSSRLQSSRPITSPPPKSRMTEAEIQKFTYEGLTPLEADASGCYPPTNWLEETSLKVWGEILGEGNRRSNRLLLPPLLLNEDIISSKVPIVMYAERLKDEFRIHGGFHPNVVASVSPWNVQLKLSFTYTKNDNTKWLVDNQIIATVCHGANLRLFTLYDFPFDSLSPLSPPKVSQISIRKISPEQKWYYLGLAACVGQNGIFDTIRGDSLKGTFDCAREWKKMVENGFGNVSLPPLLIKTRNMKDVAVCVYCRRGGDKFQFHVKFHPSTRKVAKLCANFIVDLYVTTVDKSSLTMHGDATVSMEDNYAATNIVTFKDFPWHCLSPIYPPRFRFQVSVNS